MCTAAGQMDITMVTGAKELVQTSWRNDYHPGASSVRQICL